MLLLLLQSKPRQWNINTANTHVDGNLCSVTWLAKTVLTDEERGYIRSLALELADIRKQLDQLAETMAKLNDKQFLKIFTDCKPDLTEKQVDNYQLALQKKVDAAENEFRY